LGVASKHLNGSVASVALGGWLVHVDASVNLELSISLIVPLYDLFVPTNKMTALQSK
jgi:hypothetical protein